MAKLYDCDKCPAYCCSSDLIVVTRRDMKRLAKAFNISVERAERRFTKKGKKPGERVLRHQEDEHFGSICHNLDTETRRCTIYDARPEVCRDFPGEGRCGYYDFLAFEREAQEDPEWVARTD